MTVVVDTNVILVANGQHKTVSDACVAACAKRLKDVMRVGRIAIDDGFRILREYQQKTTPRVGKGPGDAFVKWVLQNNANSHRCDQVPLDEHAERGFHSFPDDSRLANFDTSDRKFVAVSRAHQSTPPILQATDSKWLGWASALKECGVSVEFLCRDDIERFDDGKRTRKGKKR
jgi:hypothetical protein